MILGLVAAMIGAQTAPAWAAVTADYRFADSYASSVGAPPAMTDIGDIPNAFRTETVNGVSRRVLNFACNSGLEVSTAGVIDQSSYSIAVLFRMTHLGSWNRILDFNDGVGDDGLYVFNGKLNFYPEVTSPDVHFAPNTYAQVVMTRAADGMIRGYVNGVEALSLDDSGPKRGVLDEDVLRFFRDNDGGGGPTTEASAGAVARVRLFNHVLSAGEVAALDDTPPPAPTDGDVGTRDCDLTPPEHEEPTNIPRLDGDGSGDVRRVAIQVCQFLFDQPRQSRTIILARNDVFADALAGSPLAGDHSCVLYTTGGPGQPLDPETDAEIKRSLAPGGTVRILGGENAVSAQVADHLQQSGFAVQRFTGTTRFETAAGIARTVRAENPGNTSVMLAYGYNFPDAVTGGAYGAKTGTPILLTPTDRLHGATAAAVADLGVDRTIVLGGVGVVSPEAASATPNPMRVSGSNRMSTATQVATQLWSQVVGQVSTVVVANIDRDDGWALTLAAAPLSARYDAPQVGVGANRYPGESQAFLQGLSPRAGTAYVLGNVDFISDAIAQQVAADLSG